VQVDKLQEDIQLCENIVQQHKEHEKNSGTTQNDQDNNNNNNNGTYLEDISSADPFFENEPHHATTPSRETDELH
jgi:hypothetical protein